MGNKTTKNVILATVYLITFLLCIAAISLSQIIGTKGHPLVEPALNIAIILQLIGIIFYTQTKKPTKNILVKCFLKVNLLSIPLSIACFVPIMTTLLAQFHNEITPDSSGEFSDLTYESVDSAVNSYVYETDDFYIIFPKFNNIAFTTRENFSKSEEDITFCGSATFLKQKSLDFSHKDIAGLHAESGELYKGYDVDSLVAFSCYGGKYLFDMSGGDESIRIAAENGGSGFFQFPLIINGEHNDRCIKGDNRPRCFRALAEKDNRLFIIDAKRPVVLSSFINGLLNLNLRNAIYLDMGSYWNYSWYRNNDNKAIDLFSISQPFSGTWIVFKKQ
ncbi:MAG: hypothetical protein HUJ62_07680 [Streptococcus gallolyticus]|nr:hypothetical protein [Streptococcus gallolyticus]